MYSCVVITLCYSLVTHLNKYLSASFCPNIIRTLALPLMVDIAMNAIPGANPIPCSQVDITPFLYPKKQGGLKITVPVKDKLI